MQIQEVSNLTGLTKRTIRFYIEKELIDPEVIERNGKEYREYSDKDIKELLTIAELRKALFTIEQIKVMLDHPSDIPDVLRDYHKELIENHKNLSRLMTVMEGLRVDSVKDIYDLSDAVSEVSKEMRLPQLDITPHFGRLDREFGPEEGAAIQHTKYFTKWFALFLASVILIVGSISFIGWNNRTLNPKFAGEKYHYLSKETGKIIYYSDDGKTVSVSTAQDQPVNTRRGYLTYAYSTYSILVTYPDGSQQTFGYVPTNSSSIWVVGKYDLSGFTLPGKFLFNSRITLVEDYEAISPEVRFIIDSITAYRNYLPFYRAMVPVYIAVPAAFFLWLAVIVWWNGRKSRQSGSVNGSIMVTSMLHGRALTGYDETANFMTMKSISEAEGKKPKG